MSDCAPSVFDTCHSRAQRCDGLSVDFAAIYVRHRDLVYRLALRYASGRRAFAEDVVQDVFIAALEDRRFCAGECEPAAWLYRVTVNRCLTRLKRERVFRLLSGWLRSERPVEQRTPERACGGSEAITRIERWFEELPPLEKVVFAMHLHDHKSQQEIAAIMGLSKGYISKLLSRVQSKLSSIEREEGDV